MTGFGRASERTRGWHIGCEARSVNHRFLDLRIFLPEGLGELEEAVRRSVEVAAARGRVEIRISADRNGGGTPVRLDHALARALAGAARSLARIPGVRGGVNADRLLDFPGLVRIDASPRSGGPALRAAVRRCVERALARLDASRRVEGKHLTRDLARRLRNIERVRRMVYQRAAEMPRAAHRRLLQRLGELGAGTELDPGRVAQEAAILAARADISEELVKLAGILAQARALLEDGRGPVGKRLDFLVQEMNREANTIGSKSGELRITTLAVEMKTEIEKVREQVQNLE
jgi:uncharacterized protein (TIGR00255 family)